MEFESLIIGLLGGLLIPYLWPKFSALLKMVGGKKDAV